MQQTVLLVPPPPRPAGTPQPSPATSKPRQQPSAAEVDRPTVPRQAIDSSAGGAQQTHQHQPLQQQQQAPQQSQQPKLLQRPAAAESHASHVSRASHAQSPARQPSDASGPPQDLPSQPLHQQQAEGNHQPQPHIENSRPTWPQQVERQQLQHGVPPNSEGHLIASPGHHMMPRPHVQTAPPQQQPYGTTAPHTHQLMQQRPPVQTQPLQGVPHPSRHDGPIQQPLHPVPHIVMNGTGTNPTQSTSHVCLQWITLFFAAHACSRTAVRIVSQTSQFLLSWLSYILKHGKKVCSLVTDQGVVPAAC